MSENGAKDSVKKKNNSRNHHHHPGRGSHSHGGHSGSYGRRRNNSGNHDGHKINMKLYERMINEIQNNFSDIKMSNTAKDDCSICCKSSDIFGVAECRHPICIECALRIRVLNGQKSCPVCRTESELIHLLFASNGLNSCPLLSKTFGHPAEDRFGVRFENEEVGARYEQYLSHVCKLCKTPDGDRLEFPTFQSLRQHMTGVHQLSYCNICTENLNLFSRERRTYTRESLQRHIRCGDLEDKSQRGHPTCLFCDQRFFDNEGQYRHLRKDHFFCQFCESDGTMTNAFFNKHEELLKHYKEKHFLCEHEDCRSAGIAFSNKVEFDVHRTQHSGRGVQLDFQYNDRQVGRPGRMRREQQRFQSQPNERIAVLPQPPAPVQPPPPNVEIVVVPSAQSQNRSIRYGGSSYTARQEDFPTLVGTSSSVSSAPQVVVPQEFPRLNRVGKATGTKPSSQKKAEPVEDFPSLGGRSSQQQQQTSNWGAHTGTFLVIDDDERVASASQPQLPKSVLQPPKPAQAKKQSGAGPSNPTWAAKAQGRSAITGVVIPKKKPPPVSNAIPEKSVTSPASSYQQVEESWNDVPYTKKLTVKQKKELQKLKEQNEMLKTQELIEDIQKNMMVPPDEDLEMQATLMNDIVSSMGPTPDVTSTESSRDSGISMGRQKVVLKENNATKGPQSTSSLSKNQQKNKKQKKSGNEYKKPEEKSTEFPTLQSTFQKTPVMESPTETETNEGGGISSWLFSSVSNIFSGLSLSNVLGEQSQSLSSMETQPAHVPEKKKDTIVPPPGLAQSPTKPVTATTPISFAAPPGFENFVPPGGPPPGLSSRQDTFTSAPVLSHQDVMKTESSQQDFDGWSKVSAKAKAM